MSDFCAWCAKPLPLDRRDPVKREKADGVKRVNHDLALCVPCENQAENEGYKKKP